MKQQKLNVNEFEACAVTVEVEGNVEEYAMNFLHIFNNVRENKELLKIKNHYDSNDVTVYCKSKFKDSLVKYLKMFGKIKNCKNVLVYELEEPYYDFDKYDEVVIATEFE